LNLNYFGLLKNKESIMTYEMIKKIARNSKPVNNVDYRNPIGA